MQGSTFRNSKLFPWFVWAVAAAFFFFVYLVRVSPSVMTLELMRDFNTGALIVGILMSCFYWPYVAMQVPVGLLVDRFGAQRLLSIMAVLAAMGCLVFAFSHNIIIACLSRVVIGFAAAFCFVGVIKLAATWHSKSRLGLIVGLTQSIAMLGAYFASHIAKVNSILGWRNTLVILACLLVLSGLAIYKWATPKTTVKHVSEENGIMLSLKEVLKNPQSWLNAFFVGFFFAPTGVFGENWGATFFQQVYGLSVDAAASINAMIFVGWILGGPVLGWWSDHMKKRKPIMIVGNLIVLCCLSMVVYTPQLQVGWLYLLIILMGIASSGVTVGYTLSTEINKSSVSGTSLAFANMSSVIIGTVLLPIVGWILDNIAGVDYSSSVPVVYSATAFHYAFLPIIIGLAIGAIIVMFIKETNGKTVDDCN